MRKTSIKAFEERHPKAAIAVEQWLFAEEDRLDCKQAAARLKEKFSLSQSPESLRRFWHRCSERRMLDKIGDRARQAKAVGEALRKNPAQTFDALMGLIEQAAFNQSMDAENPLTLEQLAELTKLAIAGRRETLRSEELQFDREKYKASLKTDVEKGLDQIAAEAGSNPVVMAAVEQIRAVMKPK